MKSLKSHFALILFGKGVPVERIKLQRGPQVINEMPVRNNGYS
jgi:hypothetical protein